MQKRGIKLTSKQIIELAKLIIENNGETTNYKCNRVKNDSIQIKLSQEELDLFTSKLDGYDGISEYMINKLACDISEKLFKTLSRKWAAQDRYECKRRLQFEKRLQQRWSKALRKLRMLLSISREFGTELNAKTTSTTTPYLHRVIFGLHARACQVTDEIITLLNAGLADGAMARWRTLHEIASVALFISKCGEELAERYALHESIESLRAAKDYEKCHKALGYEPLEASEVAALEEERNKLINRFGRSFEAQFGWAAESLACNNPQFWQIEKAAKIGHYSAHYRMASHNVHANPKSIFFKLGIINGARLLLAGPSNAGLADPGHGTAISLVQASTPLVLVNPTLDAIIFLKLVARLEVEIGQAFGEAHKQLLIDAAQESAAAPKAP